MNEKNKKYAIVLTFLFCLVCAVGLFGYSVASSESFSEEENRVLCSFPRHTLSAAVDKWFDGKLSRELEGYFSDRLVFRRQLTSVYGRADLALHARASQGVLHGADGQLAVYLFDAYVSVSKEISDTDFFSSNHIKNQCSAVKALAKSLSQKDIHLYFLSAPRAVDVCASSLGYPTLPSDSLDRIITDELDGTENLTHINMLSELRAAFANGEYVLYRTDHHWATAGAYMAYREIMKSLLWGEKALTPADFTPRRIPNFIGTTASRACLGGSGLCLADTLEIWERADDKGFTVSDGEGFEMRGFIDEGYLSRKDKYGAFLSGTRNFLTVSDGNYKPRLLVAKDSFANSVIPFLARHFDITVVNLSGGMTDISEYADKYRADAVLILYNRENMVSADYLNRIK